jgi:hypothetical protein
MNSSDRTAWLEEQIAQWRDHVRRAPADPAGEIEVVERRLRSQLAALAGAGLAPDEALLVALRRLGETDVATRDFARRHAERLWRVDQGAAAAPVRPAGRTEGLVVFALAVAAAMLFKLPALFGVDVDRHEGFYARNASLFVLPLLAGYFFWQRRATGRAGWGIAAAFVAAAGFANLYPFLPGGSTELLAALHLPIALWLAVGVAHAGGRWATGDGRMAFVRFSGEFVIYYALIALGGGVLTGLTAGIFRAIGIDLENFLGRWMVPCGALGAVMVAAWLAETRQGAIGNLAPMLTRLFTPLFAAMLLGFLGTLFWTGRGIGLERDVLIGFDLLLVVVLGLHVYAVSARDPGAPPGAFDVLQVMLVLSALAANAVALSAIAVRIDDLGFTPNRLAALGENLILLANLAWSAVLYLRFLGGRGAFTALERWQTAYLPVYSSWAVVVVTVFPPGFGFR